MIIFLLYSVLYFYISLKPLEEWKKFSISYQCAFFIYKLIHNTEHYILHVTMGLNNFAHLFAVIYYRGIIAMTNIRDEKTLRDHAHCYQYMLFSQLIRAKDSFYIEH
jgi:hypothetical protein